MNIQDAVGVSIDEILLEHPHEAGERNKADTPVLQVLDILCLGRLVQSGLVFARRNVDRFDAVLAGALEYIRVLDVAYHTRYLGGDIACLHVVDDGLKIASFARAEHSYL